MSNSGVLGDLQDYTLIVEADVNAVLSALLDCPGQPPHRPNPSATAF